MSLSHVFDQDIHFDRPRGGGVVAHLSHTYANKEHVVVNSRHSVSVQSCHIQMWLIRDILALSVLLFLLLPPEAEAQQLSIDVTGQRCVVTLTAPLDPAIERAALSVCVLMPDEPLACKPARARRANRLDFTDPLARPRNAGVADAWTVRDSSADYVAQTRVRTYTAVLSVPRLRQQFVGRDAGGAALAGLGTDYIEGAVTGGAVAAVVYACVVTDAAVVLASASAAVTAKSDAGAPDVAVRAFVQSASATPSSTASIVTLTQALTGCDGSATTPPHLEFARGSLNGYAAAAAVSSPRTANCGQIIGLGVAGVCPVCVQTFAVAATPVARTVPTATDIATTYVLNTGAADGVGLFMSLKPQIHAHFVVPAPAARTEPVTPAATPHMRTLPHHRAVTTPEAGNAPAGPFGVEAHPAPAASAATAAKNPLVKMTVNGAEVVRMHRRDEPTRTATRLLKTGAGERNCVVLEPTSAPSATVFVDEAVLTENDAVVATVARDGAIDADYLRSARASMTHTPSGTALCFSTPEGLRQYRLEIRWSLAKRTGAGARNVADDLGAWCLAQGANCTGIFVVDTVLDCVPGTVYDAIEGACVIDTTTTVWWQWILWPSVFIVLIVIVAVIFCLAERETNPAVGVRKPNEKNP